MILLHYKKYNETLICHKLSYGVNTFNEIIEFIAESKNVNKENIVLTMILNGNITKIKKDNFNNIIPIALLKQKSNIRYEIEPNDIEKKLIDLINNIKI